MTKIKQHLTTTEKRLNMSQICRLKSSKKEREEISNKHATPLQKWVLKGRRFKSTKQKQQQQQQINKQKSRKTN